MFSVLTTASSTRVFELLPYQFSRILFNPVSLPTPAASIRSRKTSPLSPGVSGRSGSSTDAAGSSEGDLLLQVWLQLFYSRVQ